MEYGLWVKLSHYKLWKKSILISKIILNYFHTEFKSQRNKQQKKRFSSDIGIIYTVNSWWKHQDARAAGMLNCSPQLPRRTEESSGLSTRLWWESIKQQQQQQQQVEAPKPHGGLSPLSKSLSLARTHRDETLQMYTSSHVETKTEIHFLN